MCRCNKGCGFNVSRTTGFHGTWAACLQNNQPFTLPATSVFQKKMVSASITVHQVASNNVGCTQSPPPIHGGTDPAPDGCLHHMGSSVLAYHYAFQNNYVCEHHNNSVSDPELSSFVADLQKGCNLNYLGIV